MFIWPVLPRSEKQSSQHLALSLPAEPRFQVRTGEMTLAHVSLE